MRIREGARRSRLARMTRRRRKTKEEEGWPRRVQGMAEVAHLQAAKDTAWISRDFRPSRTPRCCIEGGKRGRGYGRRREKGYGA